MSRDEFGHGGVPGTNGQKYELLERVTAVVLALVAVSLAWLLLAGNQVAWVRPVVEDWKVVLILALFTTALGLVSVLALLKTRE